MGNGTDKADYICARGREVKNMSHLAILEYQWVQKSFLDWPRVPVKNVLATQLGIEEIRYVWINPVESLVTPSLHQVHTGCSWPNPSLCTTLALSRAVYVPLGQWHLVINEPSCRCITEAQSLMGLQRALSTEQSFMSDKTEKIASQVEKEERGAQEGTWGMEKRRGVCQRNWYEDKISKWIQRGPWSPFSSPGTHWGHRGCWDTLQPHGPHFHCLSIHLPSTEWVWDLVVSHYSNINS